MYPRDNIELYYLSDFNLPKTNWSTMYSICQSENGILHILNDHLLHALLTDSTHSAGHTLDNILSTDFYSFSLQRIDSSCSLDDHYPILPHLNNCKSGFPSPSLSSVLVSTLQPKWKPSVTGFSPLSSQFILRDLLSTSTDNFGFPCHLVLTRKDPRKLSPPFTIHITVCSMSIESTLRRKCIKNPSPSNLKLLTQGHKNFAESVELDRLCFLQGTITSSASACFKALRPLSIQSITHQIKLGNSKFTAVHSLSNGFNIFLSDNFNEQYILRPHSSWIGKSGARK